MKLFKSISQTFIFFAPVVLLVAFQNCSEDAFTQGGTNIECFPEDKPCLKYKVKVASLASSKGGAQFLLQGEVAEGVTPGTQFSRNCQMASGAKTVALCPFNEKATGTIRSSDGRSLTVSMVADPEMEPFSGGTLSKIIRKVVDEAEKPDLCVYDALLAAEEYPNSNLQVEVCFK